MSLSAEYIVTSLQELYGETVTGADIRGWCAMNGSNYQTVTNKISIKFVLFRRCPLLLKLRAGQDSVGYFFRGHDGGNVGVRARNGRHDGGVNHA